MMMTILGNVMLTRQIAALMKPEIVQKAQQNARSASEKISRDGRGLTIVRAAPVPACALNFSRHSIHVVNDQYRPCLTDMPIADSVEAL